MTPIEMLFVFLTNAVKSFDETFEETPPHQIVLLVVSLFLLLGQYQNSSIMRSWRARHEKSPTQRVLDFGYELGRNVPIIKTYIESYVNAELEKQYASDLAKITQQRAKILLRDRMPEQPLSIEKILSAFELTPATCGFDFDALLANDPGASESILKEGDGKESGSLYAVPTRECAELQKVVYGHYAYLNSLRESSPRASAMRAEVIRWALNLFHDPKGYGLITHGGTTSIIEAVIAYVLLARARGVAHPEVVIPATAHAAFLKATIICGAKLILVPVDPQTGAVRAADMETYLSGNTAVMVGSAPSFMYGIHDPIGDLGKLALKKKVPLHVDACLGGFLTAFLDTDAAPMDFRVPGVSSISADSHKYGCAPKGTSFLLFANDSPVLSTYAALNWRGGFYSTPGILDGSTSSARFAELYATMAYYGCSGYRTIANDIIALRQRLQERVATLGESLDVHVFGDPQWSVMGFQSHHLNPHAIAQVMNKQYGWKLDLLQNPDGFHLCLTHVHTLVPDFEDQFIDDLKAAVITVSNYPSDHKYDGDVKAYGAIRTAPTDVQKRVGINYERSRLFIPVSSTQACSSSDVISGCNM